MLPINIHTDGSIDWLTTLLPLLLCCMLPILFRQPGGQSSQKTSESDAWFVTISIQEAYDLIVKEIDGLRETASLKQSKSRLNFLRGERAFFVVDQAVPPRLYRVKDAAAGEMSFELTAVEEGGTSIKATYDSRGRAFIQNFKAKMPIKIPVSDQKICSTCGKQMMPDFKICPFCGTKLQ